MTQTSAAISYAVSPRIVAWGLTLVVAAAGGCDAKRTEPRSEPKPSQASQQSDSPPKKVEKAPKPISVEGFHDAALNGRIDRVRGAIEQGIDVNASNPEGRTALMLAAFNGHATIVQDLLKHKADIDKRDATRRTALIYAASGPNPEAVAPCSRPRGRGRGRQR